MYAQSLMKVETINNYKIQCSANWLLTVTSVAVKVIVGHYRVYVLSKYQLKMLTSKRV